MSRICRCMRLSLSRNIFKGRKNFTTPAKSGELNPLKRGEEARGQFCSRRDGWSKRRGGVFGPTFSPLKMRKNLHSAHAFDPTKTRLTFRFFITHVYTHDIVSWAYLLPSNHCTTNKLLAGRRCPTFCLCSRLAFWLISNSLHGRRRRNNRQQSPRTATAPAATTIDSRQQQQRLFANIVPPVTLDEYTSLPLGPESRLTHLHSLPRI